MLFALPGVLPRAPSTIWGGAVKLGLPIPRQNHISTLHIISTAYNGWLVDNVDRKIRKGERRGEQSRLVLFGGSFSSSGKMVPASMNRCLKGIAAIFPGAAALCRLSAAQSLLEQAAAPQFLGLWYHRALLSRSPEWCLCNSCGVFKMLRGPHY